MTDLTKSNLLVVVFLLIGLLTIVASALFYYWIALALFCVLLAIPTAYRFWG